MTTASKSCSTPASRSPRSASSAWPPPGACRAPRSTSTSRTRPTCWQTLTEDVIDGVLQSGKGWWELPPTAERARTSSARFRGVLEHVPARTCLLMRARLQAHAYDEGVARALQGDHGRPPPTASPHTSRPARRSGHIRSEIDPLADRRLVRLHGRARPVPAQPHRHGDRRRPARQVRRGHHLEHALRRSTRPDDRARRPSASSAPGPWARGSRSWPRSPGRARSLHDPIPEALSGGHREDRQGAGPAGGEGPAERRARPRRSRAASSPRPTSSDLATATLIIEAAPEKLDLKLELFAQATAVAGRRRGDRDQHLVAVGYGDRGRRRRPRARRRHALLQPAAGDEAARGGARHRVVATPPSTSRARPARRWASTSSTPPTSPGFLVNRVNRPFSLESLKLLEERVGTAEVDRPRRCAWAPASGWGRSS